MVSDKFLQQLIDVAVYARDNIPFDERKYQKRYFAAKNRRFTDEEVKEYYLKHPKKEVIFPSRDLNSDERMKLAEELGF